MASNFLIPPQGHVFDLCYICAINRVHVPYRQAIMCSTATSIPFVAKVAK